RRRAASASLELESILEDWTAHLTEAPRKPKPLAPGGLDAAEIVESFVEVKRASAELLRRAHARAQGAARLPGRRGGRRRGKAPVAQRAACQLQGSGVTRGAGRAAAEWRATPAWRSPSRGTRWARAARTTCLRARPWSWPRPRSRCAGAGPASG